MEAITPLPWSDATRKALRPAGGVKHIEKEVLAGKAQLWRFGQLLIVTRQEPDTFVVVAVAGKGLTEASRAIHQAAIQSGLPLLRFHTKHPERLKGVLRLWPLKLAEVRKGLFRHEYIYSMRLR